MSFIDRFSTYHLDILREIGNIGAGHAATSLSKLLNQKIDMTVPAVRLVSFDEMMDIAGGPDRVIVSVFLRIEGDAPGSMFFIVPPEQADRLVRDLTGDTSFTFTTSAVNEMAFSAILELGNILSGSYLSSLSDFTQLSIQPSVPSVSVDMVGAVLSFGLLELSQQSDHAIVVDTSLNEGESTGEEVNGHFFLLPDPDSFETIFNALGVTAYE
ncbi:CheY-P-specific phosphatase CheC [Pontibacillus yanchengensis]|uniref:CheY-P-specific phosphatase CheC n=2 Tax=Pontibacillus yanchengensis TaxID=462910 RepID=A0ACC7VCW9_9BACI|nr:chemotaxis protein CheC [Pontibacillus yanchengensis]MYL33165.1 CheY-P-specific phosphatase CheC [Pontibacillus yanchengensis]MYL51985.1 CheY-P-specific phosphatase CheC [Pontibacillus yanchengensis]